MTKSELRSQFLSGRRALQPDELIRRNQQITDQFLTFFPEKFPPDLPIVVHTFLPILRQNEVDTWTIIRTLWADYPQVSIAASITDFQTNTLKHRQLTPVTKLVENRWGIPEPESASPIVRPEQLDVVLVPLLTFDRQGNRVGYGGGFYDRFLAQCRPNCLKVGLSLFEVTDCIDDIELIDVPLTNCLTPTTTHSFTKI